MYDDEFVGYEIKLYVLQTYIHPIALNAKTWKIVNLRVYLDRFALKSD